jgi:hypothetical protein
MTKQTKFRLAVGAFGLPFAVATIGFFAGLAGVSAAPSFEQWADFISTQAPWLLGLYAASDVTHKALLAKLAPGLSENEKPES